MMRSLYSGVAGLKTHQTKMDVIGNNIANVNTVAFKSSSVTFSEIMYQTTQGASGPNALTGTGGINAKQIGLGVTMASTMTNINTAGATQTTGGAFDVKINGGSFFVVSDGTNNMFTRAGSFYVDAAGNLAMTSTGYNVMGWQVDPSTGAIKKDTVSPLRIMQAKNMTSAPEATNKAVCTGVLDSNAQAVSTADGYIMNLNFYDALGYSYTGRFKVTEAKDENGNVTKGLYNVALTDVLDTNGESVLTSAVRAKDLFGTAYAGQEEAGTLKAGRNINSEIAKTKDAAGVETETTDPVILHYWLTNSENSTLENSDIYVGEDTGLFYMKVTEGTTVSYVPLSNTEKKYAAQINLESAKIQQYFADNYSGIDSTLVITGSSKYVDATTYVSHLNLGDERYQLDTNYRLVKETRTVGDKELDTYYIVDKGTKDREASTNYKMKLELDENGKISAVDYWDETTSSTQQITDLDTEAGFLTFANQLNNYLDSKTTASDWSNTTPIKELKNIQIGGMTEKANGYQVKVTGTKYYEQLKFNTDDGKFMNIGNADMVTLAMSSLGGNFEDIDIDFTSVTNFNNGGSSTMGLERGGLDGSTGAGKKLGALTGVSIDTNGMIYGSYDNGNTVLLGQIAVATFANASGLEKVGDNCYQTTLNSGEFDGIGVDITADGGSMTTGALEMSNVDLSSEFTDMITTQRGFQANSRIITTSDTLLEELINLKR